MSLTSLNVESRPEWEPRFKSTDLSHLPFVTLLLIAANVVVFLLMVVRGVPFFDPKPGDLIPWGADFGPLTTSGQPWRVLTACFLHSGIIHLAMNMYILLQVGTLTEEMFGPPLFLLLYLVAGICGNVAGLYLHPFTVSVGASGAIFGLYGGLFAFLLIRRAHLPPERTRAILRYAGFFLFYNLIYGFANATTDLVAHGGGLLSGFIFGCPLALLRGPREQRRYALGSAGSLGLAALLAIAFWKLPHNSRAQGEFFREVATGQRLPAGFAGSLVYNGAVTRAQAEAVAEVLVRVGYYKAEGNIATLERRSGAAFLSLPVKSHKSLPKQTAQEDGKRPAWENDAFVGAFRFFGPQLASASGGLPFAIQFLDETGELRKTLPIDRTEVLVGDNDRVGYSGEATAKDALTLGDALRSLGFLRGKGGLVDLSKQNGVPEVRFFINDGHWGDANLVTSFAHIGGTLAPSLGGPPLDVVLVNETRNEQKRITLRGPGKHTPAR